MSTRAISPLCDIHVDASARQLETVTALKGLSFYHFKKEGGDLSINGRSAIVNGLTPQEAEALAEDLNRAVSQVLAKKIDTILCKVANQMRRWL